MTWFDKIHYFPTKKATLGLPVLIDNSGSLDLFWEVFAGFWEVFACLWEVVAGSPTDTSPREGQTF